jgi:hypothetical protein
MEEKYFTGKLHERPCFVCMSLCCIIWYRKQSFSFLCEIFKVMLKDVFLFLGTGSIEYITDQNSVRAKLVEAV